MGLSDFFDPVARQSRKLDSLKIKCAELRAAHAEAVAVGDDTAEAKHWAALLKAEGELRAVSAAVEAAQAHAKRAEDEAQRNAHHAALQAVEAAQHRMEDAAVNFAKHVLKLAPQVEELKRAFESTSAAKRAAGLDAHTEVAGMNLVNVWDHAMRGLAREVGLQFPQVVRGSGAHESIEDRIARKRVRAEA